jgi:hypothetical protein
VLSREPSCFVKIFQILIKVRICLMRTSTFIRRTVIKKIWIEYKEHRNKDR